MPSATLDAIVIGAGPSGLGASIALAGWRARYVNRCAVESLELQNRLQRNGQLSLANTPVLAEGLKGRSNNPLALLFDALQHPGVDRGWSSPSCLDLLRDPDAELSHVVIDEAPFGGSWHYMHEATRTLSPGPWMELPGYPLADYLTARGKAATAAAARQPRRLIAEYYEAAACVSWPRSLTPWACRLATNHPCRPDRHPRDRSAHFGVTKFHRRARVTAVQWTPHDSSSGHLWTVELSDGSLLKARSLVLATGTYGTPRLLGIEGEALSSWVAHRCTALPEDARTVLVVGAGLSAADCIVYLLTRGKKVVHAFRGAPETTKLGSKFSGPGASGFYPEYHAICTAMASAAGQQTSLFGGTYSPMPSTELLAVHSDGRCELSAGDGVERKAVTSASASVTVDAVAVLIGSEPDLSFLPAAVLDTLDAAGPPSQVACAHA